MLPGSPETLIDEGYGSPLLAAPAERAIVVAFVNEAGEHVASKAGAAAFEDGPSACTLKITGKAAIATVNNAPNTK
jgi:hypothetical protein